MHVSISIRVSHADAPENAQTTVRAAKTKNLTRALDREIGITISYGGRPVSVATFPGSTYAVAATTAGSSAGTTWAALFPSGVAVVTSRRSDVTLSMRVVGSVQNGLP